MTDTMRLDTAKLARLRRRAGLSYRQLSARCGISHVQLSRLESGASQPQPSTLLAIARALGVDDPNDLLEEQAAA